MSDDEITRDEQRAERIERALTEAADKARELATDRPSAPVPLPEPKAKRKPRPVAVADTTEIDAKLAKMAAMPAATDAPPTPTPTPTAKVDADTAEVDAMFAEWFPEQPAPVVALAKAAPVERSVWRAIGERLAEKMRAAREQAAAEKQPTTTEVDDDAALVQFFAEENDPPPVLAAAAPRSDQGSWWFARTVAPDNSLVVRAADSSATTALQRDFFGDPIVSLAPTEKPKNGFLAWCGRNWPWLVGGGIAAAVVVAVAADSRGSGSADDAEPPPTPREALDFLDGATDYEDREQREQAVSASLADMTPEQREEFEEGWLPAQLERRDEVIDAQIANVDEKATVAGEIAVDAHYAAGEAFDEARRGINLGLKNAGRIADVAIAGQRQAVATQEAFTEVHRTQREDRREAQRDKLIHEQQREQKAKQRAKREAAPARRERSGKSAKSVPRAGKSDAAAALKSHLGKTEGE